MPDTTVSVTALAAASLAGVTVVAALLTMLLAKRFPIYVFVLARRGHLLVLEAIAAMGGATNVNELHAHLSTSNRIVPARSALYTMLNRLASANYFTQRRVTGWGNVTCLRTKGVAASRGAVGDRQTALYRGRRSTDESLAAFAANLLESAEKLDASDESQKSPHTRELLIVFLSYLKSRRRQLTVENVSAIVDDPPIALYPDLTAALRSIPRGSHAAALTSLRSQVRKAVLMYEMNPKRLRETGLPRSSNADRPV